MRMCTWKRIYLLLRELELPEEAGVDAKRVPLAGCGVEHPGGVVKANIWENLDTKRRIVEGKPGKEGVHTWHCAPAAG